MELIDYKYAKILKNAEDLRKELNHNYVGTEHIILSILKFYPKEFSIFGLSFKNFYNDIKKYVGYEKSVSDVNVYTPLVKKIIMKSNDYKTLFYNILSEGEGVAIRILENENVDIESIINYLSVKESPLELFKYGKLLNKTVDLKERVYLKEKEINEIITTLARKNKCNPLLIGDAGVGKSAIVEELVRKIVLGDVPMFLKDKKIVMLETSSLVAGTRYRGDFEDRINKILLEVENRKDIILFIDEVHTMINAGGAEGAICASDILKPYLARGKIKLIGATTYDEYEKYIEENRAISRRFNQVFVNEPSLKDNYEILKKVKSTYEVFHKVKISDENIKLIIDFADKYYPDKKNPDKSIELLDDILSYVKIKYNENIRELLENKLNNLIINKMKYYEDDDFKNATYVGKKEKILRKKLNNISFKYINVSKKDIIDYVNNKNNITINYKTIINDLYEKYDKISVKKIINKLQSNDNFIKISSLSKEFSYELSSIIKYKFFEYSNLESLCKSIKRYNTSLVFIKNSNNIINSFLNKIRDNCFYFDGKNNINFSNVIFLINDSTSDILLKKANTSEMFA